MKRAKNANPIFQEQEPRISRMDTDKEQRGIDSIHGEVTIIGSGSV
jgi:hypothetical protein